MTISEVNSSSNHQERIGSSKISLKKNSTATPCGQTLRSLTLLRRVLRRQGPQVPAPCTLRPNLEMRRDGDWENAQGWRLGES